MSLQFMGTLGRKNSLAILTDKGQIPIGKRECPRLVGSFVHHGGRMAALVALGSAFGELCHSDPKGLKRRLKAMIEALEENP